MYFCSFEVRSSSLKWYEARKKVTFIIMVVIVVTHSNEGLPRQCEWVGSSVRPHRGQGDRLERRIDDWQSCLNARHTHFLTLDPVSPPRESCWVMSTPVIFFTLLGTLAMIMSTSLVSLAAPISLEPSVTILIFLACDKGAAISAATCETKIKE